MFDNITVIGLGLLGGSVCKSIKKNFGNVYISTYGRSLSRLKAALDDGIVDHIGSMEQLDLKGVNLVIVSTPVVSSVEIIKEILKRPDFGDNAIIIDVGSVKYQILNEIIMESKKASRFIGCHPMAGSEESGYTNSSEKMFENSSVILTPNEFNHPEDIQKVKVFWESLKSKVTIIDAEIHDKNVAFTSHMPHIISCFIVKILKEYLSEKSYGESISPFIGKGFLDTTRISASSPEMWCDILEMNKSNISNSLKKIILHLEDFSRLVDEIPLTTGSIYDFFKEIKDFRDKIR